MQQDLKKILIDPEAIWKRLEVLAAAITANYQEKELTVLAVLNGSLFFAADLLRLIPLSLKLETLSVASYHGGTETSGEVSFNQERLPDLKGRHVLIIDDILDTGLTLHAIRERLLGEAGAASVRICVLLRKNRERLRPIDADYVGFEIGNEFVVGYGLDYDGRYRNLPFIGVL